MTPDLLDDLCRANPVRAEELEVPAAVAARALGPAPRRHAARRLAPVLAVALAAVAAGALLLLARGASPDLAARAYAATSGNGIIHWRTDMFNYVDGRLGVHQGVEGWSRGRVTHILRLEFIHGKEHVDDDERRVGRHYRVWLSGSDDWTSGTLPAKRPALEMVPSGDPMVAFRRAYRSGKLRDLGGGRFEVPFRHVAPGTVVYEVDPTTGRPRRLVIRNDQPALPGRPAHRLLSVIRFSVYETLPETATNRAKLALLPHPGSGPGREPASRYFGALRTGPRPAGALAAKLRRMAGYMSHPRGRFGLDPSGIRGAGDGLWLIPGRGYLCLISDAGAGSLGGTCATVRKAVRDGISIGSLKQVIVLVPDGVVALQARYRWHGPWHEVPLHHGIARLPGLGYQTRLVR
jgi:hypothetical protein